MTPTQAPAWDAKDRAVSAQPVTASGAITSPTGAQGSATPIMAETKSKTRGSRRSRLRVWLSILGPGIIATAAGNDAGGIFTYIQCGAAFEYSLIWSIIFVTLPYYVVQEMCARMAAVTGKGLADLIRENYGVKITFFAMIIQLIANLATTVTEFAGISAACRVFGLSDELTRYIAIPGSIALTWFLLVGNSYRRVERVFLVMSALLLCYVVVALKLHPHWLHITHEAIFPPIAEQLHKNGVNYITMMIQLIGTTIAPYQQFYLQSAIRDKGVSVKNYSMSRIDTLFGCISSNIISIFIVIACAMTLFAHGVNNVTDAGQAAISLEPIAGEYARYLFGIGLLGASLLAAVVVPLTTAYAVTESLGWETGVGRKLRESPLFYVTYGSMLLFGGILVMLPNMPLVKIILNAQIVNAVLLSVELVLIILLSSKKRLMGAYANSPIFNAIAWTTVGIVIILSISYFVMSLFPNV